MTSKPADDSTILFSVLYPGLSDTIIRDYVESILRQTDQHFDWLMINDNCRTDQIGLFPKSVSWIDLDRRLSFGKIREIGILYAIANGYRNIVFSDVDDYYSENRVQLSKRYLSENDFVFSEVQIVNIDKELVHSDFIAKFSPNRATCAISDILNENFIGLSHSAVRLSCLRNLEIPVAIEVVDWWLFSVLLIRGHRGHFIPEADTFYRQNTENYVGALNRLDPSRLKRGVGVKLTHYAELEGYCRSAGKEDVAGIFSRKHVEMELLSRAIREPRFARRYIDRVNENFNKVYRGWWSEIIPLEIWEQL